MTILPPKEHWTDIQKEIWRSVETYTDLILKGKVNQFLDYFHEEYAGWNDYDMLPVNKDDIKGELSKLPKYEIDSFSLIPLVINNFKDIAIVHYYFSIKYSEITGKNVNKNGRNTDILLYQNNRWVLIGDHVGFTKTINKNSNFNIG
jgi:ketosteroid isomerase-like protein